MIKSVIKAGGKLRFKATLLFDRYNLVQFFSKNIIIESLYSCSETITAKNFIAASKDGTAGIPNLQLYDVKTGTCLKSFIQKKMQNW